MSIWTLAHRSSRVLYKSKGNSETQNIKTQDKPNSIRTFKYCLSVSQHMVAAASVLASTAFLSVNEIIDIVIMTVFVGFIFSDVFSKVRAAGEYSGVPDSSSVDDSTDNPSGNIAVRNNAYLSKVSRFGKMWSWENFSYAIIVTAPAIILHEFGHKFVAMAFGLKAVFNAAYSWLAVGLVLKLIGFPYIFFVPAYVSIIGNTAPLNFSLIAFAGPAVNLVLWLGALLIQKKMKMSARTAGIVNLTKQINMFLFIFNMLPVPGFDGAKVFSGLLGLF